MKKLHIEEHKEKDCEEMGVKYKNIGYFYDTKHHIGIYKKQIDYELQVGTVYDFTFDNWEDIDTYCYIVLKKDKDIYYLAECYNKTLYRINEKYLTEAWIKCDVREWLGIDIDEWNKKLRGI